MLDYLITNARIIDPESEDDFYGSLGIKGTTIDCLLHSSSALPSAKETIDAEGGIIIPGFIDVHTHTENSILCAEKILAMGVTTAVSGNCGHSTDNIETFLAKFDSGGYPVNQVEQIGYSVLRRGVGLDDINRPADASHIDKMKQRAKEAFSSGAAGISFGIEYTPGACSREIIELAKVAAEEGRFISIHGRLESPSDLDSLREALDLALITRTPLIYSHLVYMYYGENLKKALDIIEEYRAKSPNIWVDSGMYTALTTVVRAPCFSEEIFLNDESKLSRLRAATGKYAGQFLDREKYLEMRKHFPNESFIYEPGDPDDVFTAYASPDILVSSDCVEYKAGQGHPQAAATYPYFFRLLVKETGKLTLLDAIRRCTLLPAKASGFTTKGRLSAGMDADVVVLDWQQLREHADFPGKGDPGAPPSGVKHVFVNGVLCIQNEKRLSGTNGGRSIRR